jgi:hypothetical protein
MSTVFFLPVAPEPFIRAATLFTISPQKQKCNTFFIFFCDAVAPLLPSTHDGNTAPATLATRFPKTDEYTQQRAHTFQ